MRVNRSPSTPSRAPRPLARARARERLERDLGKEDFDVAARDAAHRCRSETVNALLLRELDARLEATN